MTINELEQKLEGQNFTQENPFYVNARRNCPNCSVNNNPEKFFNLIKTETETITVHPGFNWDFKKKKPLSKNQCYNFRHENRHGELDREIKVNPRNSEINK